MEQSHLDIEIGNYGFQQTCVCEFFAGLAKLDCSRCPAILGQSSQTGRIPKMTPVSPNLSNASERLHVEIDRNLMITSLSGKSGELIVDNQNVLHKVSNA